MYNFFKHFKIIYSFSKNISLQLRTKIEIKKKKKDFKIQSDVHIYLIKEKTYFFLYISSFLFSAEKMNVTSYEDSYVQHQNKCMQAYILN